ncbi:MAG: TIGR03032 family protein, partial [Spirulina sp. DLM2.Bin59]
MNDPNAPLRSVHTTNFVDILRQLGISLVVSTYQAGKVIFVRADGNYVNTHFRIFPKAMGLAADHEKMAIGSTLQIWQLRNVPAVAAKLDPPGKHDACYLPRQSYITGDIDIHEMAYVGSDLWFVNTRFSCLCTLEDPTCSFVPRWRPPFVSAYDVSDRCHLNGLAVVDNAPRYVTALGATDSPAGWRKNKASGGILMDVQTNQFVTQGLSMPHSPRWYGDRLWVLESGKGSLATVDPATGQVETVAYLPGFTRGLDFYQGFAFIGLSQVRETAVFNGLPITQQQERNCGVWVVHLETGQIIGFLRFEEAVQEIFAVQVLPGIRFPELLNDNEELLGSSYVLPDAALADVYQGPLEFDQDEEAQFQFRAGNDRYNSGQLDAAIAHYQQCLKLKPDFQLARYNLGVIYREQERWAEAEAEFKTLLAVEPHNPALYNNLGIIAQGRGHWRDARGDFERAIALDPQFAVAHFNLGMLLLRLGEYAQGWAEAEWRWQTEEFTPFDCPQPRWQGEEIAGKTLLVHTEQGAGDAIQFSRFIPLAAQRCDRLILVCIPALMPLFRTLPG